MMKYKIIQLPLFSLLLSGCIDNAPQQPKITSVASCPASSIPVLKVSYNEAQGKYLIFHSAASSGEKLKNPLSVENLQMVQMEESKETKSDSAQLKFTSVDGNCAPILSMTQGFKIELTAPAQQTNLANQNGGDSQGSSGGSYWAPFLMGALVGNAVSSALQPRTVPAYYLPPPANSPTQNGVLTGGASGSSPQELGKNYEQKYKQPAKGGFFARKKDSSLTTADNSKESPKKKQGFFSKGGSKRGFSGSRGGRRR